MTQCCEPYLALSSELFLSFSVPFIFSKPWFKFLGLPHLALIRIKPIEHYGV